MNKLSIRISFQIFFKAAIYRDTVVQAKRVRGLPVLPYLLVLQNVVIANTIT